MYTEQNSSNLFGSRSWCRLIKEFLRPDYPSTCYLRPNYPSRRAPQSDKGDEEDEESMHSHRKSGQGMVPEAAKLSFQAQLPLSSVS